MKTLRDMLLQILHNQEATLRLWEKFVEEHLLHRPHVSPGGTPRPKKNTPAVLNAVQVAAVTGYQVRTARKMLREVRETLGKPQRSLVTVKEFCKVTGIAETEVLRLL